MIKSLGQRCPLLIAAWMLLFAAPAAHGAQALRPAGSGPVILGSDVLGPRHDALIGGRAGAFRLPALYSGFAMKARIYIDHRSTAHVVVVGLYGDANGHPGALLSTGSVAVLRGGAWTTVALAPAKLVSRRKYWLTILGEGGTLRFRLRNRHRARCRIDEHAEASLRGLPASWRGGKTRALAHCQVSAYVLATTVAPPQLHAIPRTFVSLPSPLSLPALMSAALPAPPVESSPSSAAPENSVLPVVSGTTTVGHALKTTDGTWSGSPTSFEYQWEDCDASGENCRTVEGATSSSYTLTASDAGAKMRSVVTAANAEGSTSASSNATATVKATPPPPPPINDVLPLISGTSTQGQVLSTTNGTWSGSPSGFEYQWEDCNGSGSACTEIAEATASSYTLLGSDVGHTIRVLVNAENAGGWALTPATSIATATVLEPVTPPPVNTAVPTIAGTATQGQTLSSTKGAWSGGPTGYAYQWQDCSSAGKSCANINGATSASYKLAESDAGHELKLVVTATNTGGSTPASSAATAVVLPLRPANKVLPVVSGTTRQGQVLSGTTGTWSESPTSYAYQWQDCDSTVKTCTNVSGATHSSYTLAGSDVGHKMRVVLTAANAAGSTQADSAATSSTVLPTPPTNTLAPAISGTATEGQALSGATGTWTGSPTGYTYQWEDCNSAGEACANVSAATHSSYTLAGSDVGHRMRVVVTAANAGGSTPASSTASPTVAAAASETPPAPTNTALPAITGTTTQGQTLTGTHGSWSNSPTSYSYRWEDCNSSGASCSSVSGATSSTYTLVAGDVGHTMRVVVTATNAGGSAGATSAQTAEVTASTEGAPYPACTTTLSAGANVASAVSSASAGSVICLNSGAYGKLVLDAEPSSNVTLQAAPGAHVTATGVNISGSHLVVRGLWISGEVVLQEGASFITIDHNDISEAGEGIVFNTSDCKAPNAPEWAGCEPDAQITNVIISGNHIHDIGQPGTEDAIHLDYWRNVTVVGNEFDHIIESGNHTDCLQSVYGGSELTFTRNYEHDDDCQGFFVKDGDASDVAFTDNLLLRDNEPDGKGEHFGNLAQFWNIEGLTIEGNTDWDGKGIVLVAEDAQNSPSATIDHNLFSYFSISKAIGKAYGITESYNIFDEAPETLNRSSTDSVNSKPQFKDTATDDYRLASNPNGIGIDWSPAEQQYGPID